MKLTESRIKEMISLFNELIKYVKTEHWPFMCIFLNNKLDFNTPEYIFYRQYLYNIAITHYKRYMLDGNDKLIKNRPIDPPHEDAPWFNSDEIKARLLVVNHAIKDLNKKLEKYAK